MNTESIKAWGVKSPQGNLNIYLISRTRSEAIAKFDDWFFGYKWEATQRRKDGWKIVRINISEA